MMKQLLIVKDLLMQRKSVRITVRGNSMRPHLVHERDHVLLKKPDVVHVGDIAFAEISPDHFVLHRVIQINGNHVTLRGDGNVVGTEQCSLSNICGVVTGFIRKGRTEPESINTLCYRLYTCFWMHSLPFRRYLLKLHDILFHSVKDLKNNK